MDFPYNSHPPLSRQAVLLPSLTSNPAFFSCTEVLQNDPHSGFRLTPKWMFIRPQNMSKASKIAITISNEYKAKMQGHSVGISMFFPFGLSQKHCLHLKCFRNDQKQCSGIIVSTKTNISLALETQSVLDQVTHIT